MSGVKKCEKCKKLLPLASFPDSKVVANRKDGKKPFCAECLDNLHSEKRCEVRKRVFAEYGGECVNCGQGQQLFLILVEKRELGETRSTKDKSLIWRAFHEKFPIIYELLCYNCNAFCRITGNYPTKAEIGGKSYDG